MTRSLKVLYWLAPAAVLVFILTHGVNVPFLDEWGIPNVLTAYREHRPFAEVWWSQNNEHRLLVPRVIWFALIFATQWNVKVLMVFNWLVAIAGLAALVRLACLSRLERSDDRVLWGSLVVSAMAVCTIVQHQNLLWGFQLPFFLIQTMAIVAPLCLLQPRWPASLRFGLAALCCALATYSMAHGILTWASSIFCVWILGATWRKSLLWCATWVILAGIAFSVYQIGYVHKAAAIDEPNYALDHPVEMMMAFLTLLGSQFGPALRLNLADTSLVAGFLLALAFGATALTAFWKRIPYRCLAPWLSCAAFGTAFALVVAFGRCEWGYAHLAVVSRYVTGPPLLVVALVQTSRLLLESGTRTSRPLRFLVPAGWGVLGILILASAVSILPEAARIRDARELGRQMLEHHQEFDLNSSLNPLNPLAPFGDMATGIPRSLALLEKLGLRSAKSTPFETVESSGNLRGAVDSWSATPGEPLRGGPYKPLELKGHVEVTPGNAPPVIFFKTRPERKLVGHLIPDGPPRRVNGRDRYDWSMEFRAYTLGVESAELSFFALDRASDTLVVMKGPVNRFDMRTLEKSPVTIIRDDGTPMLGKKDRMRKGQE